MDYEQGQEGVTVGNDNRELIIPLPGTYFAFRLKHDPILYSGKRVDERIYVAYIEEIFGVPLPSRLRPFHICRIRMLHRELPSIDHEAFLRDNPIPVLPSTSTLFKYEPLPVKPELPIPNCFHLPFTDTLVRVETADRLDFLDPSGASIFPVSEMRRVLAHVSRNTQAEEEKDEGDIEDDRCLKSDNSVSSSRSEGNFEVLPLVTVVDVGYDESGGKNFDGRRLSLGGLQRFDDPVHFFDDVSCLVDFIDDLLDTANAIRESIEKSNRFSEPRSGESLAELKWLVQRYLERHPAIYDPLKATGSLERAVTITSPDIELKQWQLHLDKLIWDSNLEALPGELARLSDTLEAAVNSAHVPWEADENRSESVLERLPDDSELAILEGAPQALEASNDIPSDIGSYKAPPKPQTLVPESMLDKFKSPGYVEYLHNHLQRSDEAWTLTWVEEKVGQPSMPMWRVKVKVHGEVHGEAMARSRATARQSAAKSALESLNIPVPK